MALKYAILVSLHDKQGTGYEIAKDFESGVGYFWNATSQQIYHELGKLTDAKLISFKVVPQRDRPQKKKYRITKAGKKALIEWLSQPTKIQPVRDPFLVKLFASDLIPPEVLLEDIETHRKFRSQVLAKLEGILSRNPVASKKMPRGRRYKYFTLLRGIGALKTWLSWSDQVAQSLREEKRG